MPATITEKIEGVLVVKFVDAELSNETRIREVGNELVAYLGDPEMKQMLLDFDGDLYGRHLRVSLIEHLRPEKRFDGIAPLKAQIAEDAALARETLATHGSAPGGIAGLARAGGDKVKQ